MSKPPVNTDAIFRDPQSTNPFRLKSSELRTNVSPNKSRRAVVAFFPWTWQSRLEIWSKERIWANDEAQRDHWARLIKDFEGVYAVAVNRTVRILRLRGNRKNVHTVELDEVPGDEDDMPRLSSDIRALAWALEPNTRPFEPLLLIGASSVLHVYNVVKQCSSGTLKGHGSEITSIVTHPLWPQNFFTTSRDYSTRFYNLSRFARLLLYDPPRPVRGSDHLCGPAFGLQARGPEDAETVGELKAEVEGIGIGKCLGVLWGPIASREDLPNGMVRRTRIGGHQGAVLDADIHKSRNLIATCGADGCVKIWRHPHELPWYTPGGPLDNNSKEPRPQFFRQQLPVFSSSGIHDSPVLSIRWISDNKLLSESVSKHQREHAEFDVRTFAFWQCLSLDGLAVEFNASPWDIPFEDVAESTSYRILASCDIEVAKGGKSYLHCAPGGPLLLLVPIRGGVRIHNLAHMFSVADKPAFPLALVQARQYAGLAPDSHEYRVFAQLQRENDEERYKQRRPAHDGWVVTVQRGTITARTRRTQEDIVCCSMSVDRQHIVGATVAGDVYVWSLSNATS